MPSSFACTKQILEKSSFLYVSKSVYNIISLSDWCSFLSVYTWSRYNKSLNFLPAFFPVVVFRIFPELSSTDMVVIIVKGMNLPAPSGKNLHLSVFPVFCFSPQGRVYSEFKDIHISNKTGGWTGINGEFNS